jgi:hypothetical protein
VSIIGKTRRELSQIAKHFTIEAFCSGDVDRSIDLALGQSGRGDQRQSPLQPKLMMWLVLCLSIFRSESIPAVLARLLSGLRDALWTLPLWPLEDDAISHARKRLGVDPLRRFFRLQAAQIRPEPSFHGRVVWSFDGSMLTMPDTLTNRQIFGLPQASRGRSAFPQLKIVALQDVSSRRFREIRWHRWDTPERQMALPLLPHLGERDLVLLDRGFYGVWFFERILSRGSHFLARVPSGVKLKAVAGTCRKSGDYLAWIKARIPLPEGQVVKPPVGRPATHRKARLLVRVIEYKIGRRERVRLVTSLVEAAISPREWVLQYHRRWEIELAFDELKIHQSGTAQGTPKTVFRSQTPRNVMQEAYALAAAYNLVRTTMAEAATRRNMDPKEISFVGSLRALEHMLPRMRNAPAHRLPVLYEQLLQDIGDARIDRPRRARHYPRVVKIKMSNYKLKRPCHRQQLVDFKASIRIGA